MKKPFITLRSGLTVQLLSLDFVPSTPFRNLDLNGFEVIVGGLLILTKWECYELFSARDFVEVYGLALETAEEISRAEYETLRELRAWLRQQ